MGVFWIASELGTALEEDAEVCGSDGVCGIPVWTGPDPRLLVALEGDDARHLCSSACAGRGGRS